MLLQNLTDHKLLFLIVGIVFLIVLAVFAHNFV